MSILLHFKRFGKQLKDGQTDLVLKLTLENVAGAKNKYL